MKVLVLFGLLLVLCAATLQAKRQWEGKSYKKVYKDCQKNNETRIEGWVLKKIKKHKAVELPSNFAEHKLCVLTGLGYIKEDGTISEEKLKKRIEKKASDSQNVDNIFEECKSSKATPSETALSIDTCFLKHSIDL